MGWTLSKMRERESRIFGKRRGGGALVDFPFGEGVGLSPYSHGQALVVLVHMCMHALHLLIGLDAMLTSLAHTMLASSSLS